MADEKRLDETQDDQGAANATDDGEAETNPAVEDAAEDADNDGSDNDSTSSSDVTENAVSDNGNANDGNERADNKSMQSKARTGALIAAGVIAAAAIVAAAVWAVSAVLDDDDDFSVAVDYATVATPDFFLGIPEYGDHRDRHHHYERGYRHHGHRDHGHDHHGHSADRHHRDGYRYHNYTDRQWGLNLAPLLWLLERFLGLGDWLRGYDDWYYDYRFDRDDRRYRDDGWFDYDRYDWYDDDGWSGRDDGMSDDDWNGDDGSPMPEGGMSFGFGLPEGLINEELLDLLGEELVEQLLRQLFGNDAPFQFGFAIPEALPETQQPQDSPDQFEGVVPGQIPLDPETLNQLLGRLFGSGLPLNGDGSPSGLEGLEGLLDGLVPEPATTTNPVPAVLPT